MKKSKYTWKQPARRASDGCVMMARIPGDVIEITVGGKAIRTSPYNASRVFGMLLVTALCFEKILAVTRF